jgi:hypothetical protein
MRYAFPKSLSTAAILGAALLLTACVSVGPTATASFSLAPGATPTPVPVVTPSPTLAPGQTLPPITPAPPITAPPITAPPVTEPPPTETPTAEPTLKHPDWPPGAIEAREAGDHVGETLTVCGKVASTNWVYAEPGHPTWLNFGLAYPNQRFNALIWGEQRREWPLSGKPEVVYLDKIVCVHGLIQMYKTWPQIQDLHKADIQVIP